MGLQSGFFAAGGDVAGAGGALVGAGSAALAAREVREVGFFFLAGVSARGAGRDGSTAGGRTSAAAAVPEDGGATPATGTAGIATGGGATGAGAVAAGGGAAGAATVVVVGATIAVGSGARRLPSQTPAKAIPASAMAPIASAGSRLRERALSPAVRLSGDVI